VIGATDPGSTTGVAIFGGSTPAFAKFEQPTQAQIRAILEWAKSASEAHSQSLLWVVEDQHAKIRWVPGKDGVEVPTIDFPAIKSLIRAAAVWVVLCGELGIEVEYVMPGVWQGPMLRTAPKKLAGEQLTTKQRAQIVVRETWDEVARFSDTPAKVKRVPSAKIPQDPCDAILIGRWWQLHGSKR
jgi:hypothetical protein